MKVKRSIILPIISIHISFVKIEWNLQKNRLNVYVVPFEF